MTNEIAKHTLSNWLIGGLIKSPAPAQLEGQLRQIAERSHTIQLDPYGAFFFTQPSYLDWAENEQMLVAKAGFVRINDDFITASELLHSGLITPHEVDYERIHGNAFIFCCSKHQPQFCAYKTLLSVQQLFYSEIEDTLIFANNLGAIAEFTRNKQINPKAITLHFIYRSIPGQLTYFSNIYRLRPGEVLYRDGIITRIVLRNSLRTLLKDEHNTQQVVPDSVNELFNQIKRTMAGYLKATSDTQPHWTMLLSGGIDSSVIQMAINSQSIPQGRTLSHTYAPDIDSFTPEMDYARTASRLFGTEHTFVTVPMADYLKWLTTTICILGQPPHHESSACLPPLFDHIAKNNSNIKYLFSAQGADTLFGEHIAEDIVRTLRYQHWPPLLLYLLGVALRPISRSESFRTRKSVDELQHLKQNRDSPQHPLNAFDAYTDWQMAYHNFGEAEVREALAYRRQQEVDYLDSPQIVEKIHTVDLLSDTYDTGAIDHTLSLAFDEQVVFPFFDDAMVLASYRFDARERYFKEGRTKPILKQIIEMGPAASITKVSKRSGGFRADLFDWMRNGSLRDYLQNMRRPDFCSPKNFQQVIATPSWYTWNMLTFDLFEKTVVSGISQ